MEGGIKGKMNRGSGRHRVRRRGRIEGGIKGGIGKE